ncbi:MAG: class I SAM-dependent RNA methyltransferase [Betaproteobacteria bacterium]|nr:MAG: class I SAM-dependent RNA methyltransferase [Betaproteobacteria bacterium]
MFKLFATCPRGLEALLAEDLTAADASDIRIVASGVACRGTWETVYRTNLNSRIATRLMLQLSFGKYLKEEDIYKQASKIDWPRHFDVSRTIRVYVTAIKSPLKSLEFITLRIKDAVCDVFRDQCGERPSVDTREPEVRIHAFLTAEDCTLYLDTTGAPLYQRGYRQKTVEAPLKENLAAGILRLAGWQPGTVLLDPMCGSGTFLLEAAQQVCNIAPGARRSFAFENLKGFDAQLWQRLKNAAVQGERKPAGKPTLFGRDVSPSAYRSALANLDRAGLLPAVDLAVGDILETAPPSEAGLMVCNPPYGERLEELDNLLAFYPQLGTALKQKYAGWTCYFLTADPALPKGVGLKPGKKTPLYNGALECRLYQFKMVAGFNRRKKPGEEESGE